MKEDLIFMNHQQEVFLDQILDLLENKYVGAQVEIKSWSNLVFNLRKWIQKEESNQQKYITYFIAKLKVIHLKWFLWQDLIVWCRKRDLSRFKPATRGKNSSKLWSQQLLAQLLQLPRLQVEHPTNPPNRYYLSSIIHRDLSSELYCSMLIKVIKSKYRFILWVGQCQDSTQSLDPPTITLRMIHAFCLLKNRQVSAKLKDGNLKCRQLSKSTTPDQLWSYY